MVRLEMLKDLDRISIKCRNLSVVAIVCVVAIHSNVLVIEADAPRWMYILCDVLFGKMTCWAVPFFFAASGYWFGLKECVVGRPFDYSRFYSKKFQTLVIPYVFFVLLGIISSIPLAYMQGVKHGDGIFAHMALSWDIFGVTQLMPFGNGPMWYLRSLILLFIFAPLWRVLALKAKWCLLPIACLALITPPVVIDGGIPFRLGQTSFFFLGLLLSQLKGIDRKPRGWFAVVSIVASVALIVYTACKKHEVGLVVSGIFPYVMLALVWMLYDFILGSDFMAQTRFAHYVFWIFGVHIIILNWILPPARALFNSPKMLFAMTWGLIVVTIVVSILFAVVVEKSNRKLYAILTGLR